MLPIKTTIEDIDSLSAYLKTQVGWVPLDRVKKTIEGKLADNRKLEAQKRLGLLDRDGTNLKLSDRGRKYATTDDAATKEQILQDALRSVQLYKDTIEWLHYSKVSDPTKTELGVYWHDKHADQLEGAQGAALTDAVIFFMRVAGAAGLGKFTRGAGAKPDSYLKTDSAAIEAFVTSKSTVDDASPNKDDEAKTSDVDQPAANSDEPTIPTVKVATSPAVHVNVEIHIAADATAETVAEIFKNMRRYVLNSPADVDE